MNKISGVLAALMWFLFAPAAAQTPNPILQHYRAYQAALEASDFVTAEREAAAALAASEARDGDGGRTAVLALNLATVRFSNGDAAGALSPAQRAAALAESRGDASGVPTALARLLVGRATLASDYDAGAPLLRSALEAAQAAQTAPEEIYDAAVELGQQSFAREQFDAAGEAYAIAVSFARGARFRQGFALGRARIGQAAAMLMGDISSNPRGRLSQEVADEARRYINEGVLLLAPLVRIESPNDQLTLPQQIYAEGLAWRAAVHAKMWSDGMRLDYVTGAIGDGDGAIELRVAGVTPSEPRCMLNFEYRGSFPDRAQDDGAIAGVAVLFTIDERGDVVDAEVVSMAGREEFARAMNNSTRLWRVSRWATSVPNCRMQVRVLRAVSFTFGGALSSPARLRN